MADITPDYRRKFLVVIDETEECDRAVTFAAYRVKRTGGTVVLLSVIDTADFQQFLGVEEVMRAEAREDAERLLDRRLARIADMGGKITVETVIREGDALAAIRDLIEKDKDIGILVLAASASQDGPGPLVSAFVGRAHDLHVPLTIVPGAMSDEEIIAVC